MDVTTKSKGGRPRKYADPTEKYRAYRARKKAEAAPKPAPKPAAPKFVAVDGEGVDRGRRHLYTLLGASDGSHVANRKGLSTRECFDYLLALRARFPRAVFVAFGFDYDVNMMLGDIPTTALDRLRRRGKTLVFDKRNPGHAYRVGYVAGKWFDLDYGPVIRNEAGTPRVSTRHALRIYDVYGFFQASFSATLEDWGIGSEADRDHIRAMKADRAQFAKLEPVQVEQYNALECALLVELMTRLDDALTRAGIKVSQWYGAGAISSALLKRYGVKDHRGGDVPADVQHAVMGAYHGGRIQLLQPGTHGESYSHDLNSAYPAAMRSLPCLSRGKWSHARAYAPALWAVWRVSWDLPADTPICPFPWRDSEGAIHWPYKGAGWYWCPEVDGARRVFGDAVCIHEGYTFTPADDVRPFGWIADTYQTRLAFRAQHDPAQLVIKFGLNSIYGKLAQGTGYFGRGPYQSYVWAGLVTSMTRARLFALAMKDPDAVICFATDGVFATRQLADTDEGKPLGGWEVNRAESLFIVQPGIYQSSEGGQTINRVRGWRGGEIDFQRLRREWDRKGVLAGIPVKVRRFVGMRGAASRGDMSLWRRWIRETRRLIAYPARGFAETLGGRVVRVHGDDCGPLGLSRPYTPKGEKSDLDDRFGAVNFELTEQPDHD